MTKMIPKMIQCISPVDGSIYAERPALPLADAQAAVARGKAAQPAWAARPLAERIALVQAGVVALNGMTDEVVPELAWQMGRPTRYGGEFGGVNERTAYMSGIAADALAPHVIENSAKFQRSIIRVPKIAIRSRIPSAVSRNEMSATPVAIAPSHNTDNATQSSR